MNFRQYLNEISSDHTQKIDLQIHVAENNPEKRPFNDQFGGKLRIIVPIKGNEIISQISDKIKGDARNQIDWIKGRVLRATRGIPGFESQIKDAGSIGNWLQRIKAPKSWLDWYSQFQQLPPGTKHDLALSDNVVVISRHPIDVARMSDAGGIESCHSPEEGYFSCALEDAKKGAAIAFLVNKKDGLDLQKGEIFSDEDRNIDGINPLARIRIRRFSGLLGKKKIDLAVPEARVYPNYIKVFYDTVMSWARESQKDLLNQPLSKLKLQGGFYRDTDSDKLIANLLGISEKDAEELLSPDELNVASHQQRQEIREIEKQFINRLPHFNVGATREDNFNWEFFAITLINLGENKEILKREEYFANLFNYIYKSMKLKFGALYVNDPFSTTKYITFEEENNKVNLRLMFSQRAHDPFEYRGFLRDMVKIEDSWPLLERAVKQFKHIIGKTEPEALIVLKKYFLIDPRATDSGNPLYDKHGSMFNIALPTYQSPVLRNTTWAAIRGHEFEVAFKLEQQFDGSPHGPWTQVDGERNFQYNPDDKVYQAVWKYIPREFHRWIKTRSLWSEGLEVMLSLDLSASAAEAEEYVAALKKLDSLWPSIVERIRAWMLWIRTTRWGGIEELPAHLRVPEA